MTFISVSFQFWKWSPCPGFRAKAPLISGFTITWNDLHYNIASVAEIATHHALDFLNQYRRMCERSEVSSQSGEQKL